MNTAADPPPLSGSTPSAGPPGLVAIVIAQLRRARAERTVLIAFLLAAMCGWGFLHLADEIAEGELRHFDEAVLLALRVPGQLATPIGPAWLPPVVRDLTALGSVSVLTLMVAAVAGFLAATRQWPAALTVVVSSGGGALASAVAKIGYSRPRPDLVPHGVDVATLSFPSGHAMMSAVVYLTLGALICSNRLPRSAKLYVMGTAILITMLVGLTRLYLGVHWPSDVLAGWALGAAWALLSWIVVRALESRGTHAAPGEPARE